MIYTNIEHLNLKVKTKSYKSLGESFVNWIEKTDIKLYTKRNKYEEHASSILNKLNVKFEPQCLFFDSNSKQTYFLDFLLIDKNIALEIDGKSHDKKVLEDMKRDMFFKKIGIKTIRIKNEDVSFENIRMQLLPKDKNRSNRMHDLDKIKLLINKYNTKYKKDIKLID